MTSKMPVFFVGHGTPMNIVLDNEFTRGFAALAKDVPKPKAILVVSAHWFVDGTWVTGNERPKTIHDFGGFPDALYKIQYPAPGHPALAQQIHERLGVGTAGVSSDWGLDHGSWSVLKHAFPAADVPVLQLSIDRNLKGPEHLALGRGLRGLRDEGVLIIGSGNITHNLRDAFSRMQQGNGKTPKWALAYDSAVVAAVEERDDSGLAGLVYTELGRMAHPSPDHWWPMLYAYGASTSDDAVSYPIGGWDAGSLSMRAFRFG